jgi:molybdate transport system permease protein
MDWTALRVSGELGVLTVLLLLPVGILVGRWLATWQGRGRSVVEALTALPLVLPPTVFGYYLLIAFGSGSAIGQAYQRLFGHTLVFTFEGLLLASAIVNIPFAIQPMQRAFEAIPHSVREAAACAGMPPWKVLLRIDLPLAWPGILSGMVLTFAHTLGEFGVVLMVGGSIPGQTRTISIAIYDRVQAFDNAAAGAMAAMLLGLSVVALGITYRLGGRRRHAHG